MRGGTVDYRQAFVDRVSAPAFPCVGAKSALAQEQLEFIRAGDLREGRDDARLLRGVADFIARCASRDLFTSLVLLFETTPNLDEVDFESALWERLQALHEMDAPDNPWDPSVSCDPDAPDFSMSLGGQAFYIVGLHPGSSRPARQFACAALVLNLHSQFETLRAEGRYERLRTAIAARELEFSGSRNPMLAVHGQASEARQYSGRAVGPDWACPFSAIQPSRAIARDAG